jgi:hypothetical protein
MSGKRLISMRRLGDGKIAVTTPSPKGRIQVAVCKAGVTAEQVGRAFHGWIPPAAEPSAWRRRRAAIRDRLIECALLEPVLQESAPAGARGGRPDPGPVAQQSAARRPTSGARERRRIPWPRPQPRPPPPKNSSGNWPRRSVASPRPCWGDTLLSPLLRNFPRSPRVSALAKYPPIGYVGVATWQGTVEEDDHCRTRGCSAVPVVGPGGCGAVECRADAR